MSQRTGGATVIKSQRHDLPKYKRKLELTVRSLDIGHLPGLTLFLWQDGSPFDQTMNQYMSASVPSGIDPILPMMLMQNDTIQSNSSANNNTSEAISELTSA